MMNRAGKLFSAVFLAVFLFAAGIAAQGVSVGGEVENFSLKATDGKEYSLNGSKGKKGTIVIFLSAQCPVVKAYVDRINAVAADYQSKGFAVIGINSNATESLEWVTSDKAERYSSFPVLIDTGNVVADKLGATVTPEIYLLNEKNILVFHGPIDNDRSGENIQKQYLRTALDATIDGTKIEETRIRAFGCEIKRAKQ